MKKYHYYIEEKETINMDYNQNQFQIQNNNINSETDRIKINIDNNWKKLKKEDVLEDELNVRNNQPENNNITYKRTINYQDDIQGKKEK